MEQFNDFWFYEKNVIQYIKDSIFIQTFIFNLSIYLILIYVIYYKVILYIIYWRKSNDNFK